MNISIAKIVKRAADIIGAAIGMFIFSIPTVVIALLIRIKMGSPVFFCQIRPGINEVPFTIIKFRTMSNVYGPGGSLQFALEYPDKERITKLGRWLRDTSLDELPELFNVLRGDMSLVGPRPLLLEYLGRYSSEQARRHDVKPGITGWAQINGRCAIGWDERFRLDVWYVDNYSLWLDFKILLITIKKVLCREGIVPKDQDILPPFMLSEQEIKKGLSPK